MWTCGQLAADDHAASYGLWLDRLPARSAGGPQDLGIPITARAADDAQDAPLGLFGHALSSIRDDGLVADSEPGSILLQATATGKQDGRCCV